MEKLIQLARQYRDVLLYLFFGAATTAVNMVCYFLLYQLCSMGNVPSTIFAWAISVLFAFVTNRRYVFHSAASGLKAIGRELLSFFGFRLATGALDVVIMYLAVDCMEWNSLLWKLLSNAIVIVLNYGASKLIIFKKK
ncbi:MAG: GtrA family protein [Oscillospiraceae bacterium]|nr:GtrA family protein [Oscillospiraceae bacterium]